MTTAANSDRLFLSPCATIVAGTMIAERRGLILSLSYLTPCIVLLRGDSRKIKRCAPTWRVDFINGSRAHLGCGCCLFGSWITGGMNR
jgi:hypothetical protein